MRVAWLALGLSACSAPALEDYACTQTEAITPRDDSGALQAMLDDAVAGGLPGLVVAIREKNGDLWVGASGYADLDLGAPMQTCTPMHVGTISHTFASAALLSAAEDGVVGLDEPISGVLDPDLLATVPNADTLTLRHLLAHQSGVPDYVATRCALSLLNDPHRPFDVESALACLDGEEADAEPGKKFALSNSNYVLAHAMLEAVTGKTASEALQNRVAVPAGLSATTLPLDGEAPLGTARSYGDLTEEGDIYDVSDVALGYGLLDGGVVSTAGDLTLFGQALLEADLFGTDWLRELKDETQYGKDTSYGLGLVVERDSPYGRAFGNTGLMLGTTSELWYLPDAKVTVAVMTNGGLGTLLEAEQTFSEQKLAPALLAAALGG